MKKSIVCISLLFSLLGMSCTEEEMHLEKETTNQILVKFTTAPLTIEGESRGFFDSSTKAEDWENKITSIAICVFDKEADSKEPCIARAFFSKDEIQDGEKYIGVPQEYIGKELVFYALANYPKAPGYSITLHDLLNFITQDIYTHNGTFADVTDGAFFPSGFEMAGVSEARKTTDGSITTVPILLERIINKVAIRIKIADTFSEFYDGGVLQLDRVSVTAPQFSWWFQRSNSPTVQIVGIDQEPIIEEGYHQHMFYLFENRKAIEFVIRGTFDEDGDFSTTDDQKLITYRFTSNVGNKDLTQGRNEYFRIDITIHGLPDNIQSPYTVQKDWIEIYEVNHFGK